MSIQLSSAAAPSGFTSPPELQPDVPLEKQALFVATLAQWGNVRAAAQQVGVSRAHLYRMRRASALFRNLWDAALVLARPRVEEVLADRALNGVQETVFYHGEEVATRTRYDSRLLLAHLARLDRIAATSGVIATVRDFDAELERLIDPPAPGAWDDEDGDWADEAGEAYDGAGYENGGYEAGGYEDGEPEDGGDEGRDGEGIGEAAGHDEPATAGPATDENADDAAHGCAAPPGQRPAGDALADERPERRANPAAPDDPAPQPGEDPAAAHRRAQAACIAAFSRPGGGAGDRAGFDSLDSVSCVSNSGGEGGSLGG